MINKNVLLSKNECLDTETEGIKESSFISWTLVLKSYSTFIQETQVQNLNNGGSSSEWGAAI